LILPNNVQNGALAINNVKLAFKLDDIGNPVSSFQYITKEANHMIEEFMLLANQQVAIKISKSFPDTALLRNHITPLVRKLESFVKFCSKHLGYDVDISSAKSLGSALEYLKKANSPMIFSALQLLATRSMQLAKYFCTGDCPEEEWRHYALNVAHYTHFTSPIRRYPDIIVHRLLAASLSQDTKPVQDLVAEFSLLPSKEELTRIAAQCNDRKLMARRAQEGSTQLFLCVLLKNNPVIDDAVVLSTGEKYLTVILPSFTMEKRIYFEDLPINRIETKGSAVEVFWPTQPGQKTDQSIVQVIDVISVLKVRVSTKLSKARPDLQVVSLHIFRLSLLMSDITSSQGS
jgi:exoribonuclease R